MHPGRQRAAMLDLMGVPQGHGTSLSYPEGGRIGYSAPGGGGVQRRTTADVLKCTVKEILPMNGVV